MTTHMCHTLKIQNAAIIKTAKLRMSKDILPLMG